MQRIDFLAVDLGATSGRTMLATFDGQAVSMRELTRFRNNMIPLGGHLFWDIARERLTDTGLYGRISSTDSRST